VKATRAILFSGSLLFALGCDQATKRVAASTLEPFSPISLAADLVRLELVPNPGGFLSLGSHLPDPWRTVLFSLLVPIALASACVWLLRDRQTTGRMVVGLGLVAGGGIGNWLDRLAHGAVTDFVSMGVGALRTGIFNIADVWIVAGIGLLALDLRSGSAGARPAEPPAQDGT